MKIITCYEVVTCQDRNEGKGPEVVVARFTNPAAATSASKGEGVQGSAADVRKTEIRIYETVEEYRRRNDDAVLKRALAKVGSALTAEEQEVLESHYRGDPG
jgi:hypothetical protein